MIIAALVVFTLTQNIECQETNEAVSLFDLSPSELKKQKKYNEKKGKHNRRRHMRDSSK